MRYLLLVGLLALDEVIQLVKTTQPGEKVEQEVMTGEQLIEEGRQEGTSRSRASDADRVLSHLNRLDSLSIDALEVMADFAEEASRLPYPTTSLNS